MTDRRERPREVRVRGERRIAQFGLGSACVLLVATLAILYRGSLAGPVNDVSGDRGGRGGTVTGAGARISGEAAVGYAAFAK